MFRTSAKALLSTLFVASACLAVDLPTPQKISWTSATTGTALDGYVYTPTTESTKPRPVVVYQKNLNIPRIGQEADEPIIADLLKEGDLVLVMDYAKNAKAKSPELNADSIALRSAMADKNPTLLADHKVDVNHTFVLVEGNRLARDVKFAEDGKRILAMDICYPSQPSKPVPLLMEYSCDNADRMGWGSLKFCHDTLIDGSQAAGFATAMADHPVAPPYKGYDDPMPEVFNRAREAVFAASRFAMDHTLTKQIGVIGFSRGAPIAAMAALNTIFRAHRPNEDISERGYMQQAVGAALIHGNRYDYLDLLPSDKMIPRFKKQWGDPTTQPDAWAVHSAVYYIKDPKRIAPMFLNTSKTESPEYQDGLAKFDKKLTELGVEHVYQVDDDKRGHQITTNPDTLAKIYDFFHKYLDAPGKQ